MKHEVATSGQEVSPQSIPRSSWTRCSCDVLVKVVMSWAMSDCTCTSGTEATVSSEDAHTPTGNRIVMMMKNHNAAKRRQSSRVEQNVHAM